MDETISALAEFNTTRSTKFPRVNIQYVPAGVASGGEVASRLRGLSGGVLAEPKPGGRETSECVSFCRLAGGGRESSSLPANKRVITSKEAHCPQNLDFLSALLDPSALLAVKDVCQVLLNLVKRTLALLLIAPQ